ncbi:integrin alpha [Streptomyces sp. NBC_00474]|uniref:integrin alpha n=1 Tax=Streptomyces sp. NBC_00474 TaxID=2975754 RepID=UPI002B1E1423|nr:integrin alpha [Streptomyces sp. NBC_00474]
MLATALTTGLLTAALPGTTASAAPSGLSGDFNGDGYRDVAVGAVSAKVGTVSNAGAVVVLYGSSSGVSAARTITPNTPGIPGSSEKGDRFGARVTLARGTGLTVSAPGENSGDGAGWSLRGATASGATSFGPSATGVPTTGAPNYGSVLP